MNFQYINFKGDLPGANNQDGWNMLFNRLFLTLLILAGT